MTVDDAAGQFMRLMAGGVGADMFRERGVLAMMGFEQGAKLSLDEVQKKMKKPLRRGGSVLAGVAPQMASTLWDHCLNDWRQNI